MVMQKAIERSPKSIDLQNQAYDVYQKSADIYWNRGETHSTAIDFYYGVVEIAPDKVKVSRSVEFKWTGGLKKRLLYLNGQST